MFQHFLLPFERIGQRTRGVGRRLAILMFITGRWSEAVALAENKTSPSADELYFAALSLAKLNRFPEAAEQLRRGRVRFGSDKRFPTELAGLAYRDKNYSEAKHDLHRALKLDPSDRYGRTDPYASKIRRD